MTQNTDARDAVLAQLNPEQRRAAIHGMSPLLIVAGAGTGKTTTLAHRVASLIATGVSPERILLLTFTRRAAAEMLRRVEAILREMELEPATANGRSSPISRRVWGGTFHAVGTRLLRRYGKHLGLGPDFTILDRGDAEDLMHVLRAELRLADDEDRKSPKRKRGEKKEGRFPLKTTCMNIYSRAVNTQWPLKKVLEEVFPWCAEHEEPLKKLFNEFVDRKEALGLLDYDDLLLFWQAMMEDKTAGEIVRRNFDCVLVDEYQDTNVVQAGILKGLTPDGTGLTVVGDDAQSIYSFRAATVRNILDFPEEFPGTTVVKLEQNYRSTQPILDATNQVIAEAKESHRKRLWSKRTDGPRPQIVLCEDEHEQTDYLIERILERREDGVRLAQQAVLFRASHHSMALELELARRNIPFHKYGGLKFIEAAHVKDTIAFLRLAENPKDLVAATRVLVLIPGIGQATARQLLAQLADGNFDFRTWTEARPPKAARTDWPLFTTLMISLSQPGARQQPLSDQLYRVRRFYSPLMERKYDDTRARSKDLEQLEAIAGRFRDRVEFLTEMTLDPPSSTQDLAGDPYLDEDYLILSTIHSAKGLEWDSVFVIHAADGNIPSDMATDSPEQIEEERRLFYVALTRAKDHLYVTIPQRYYFHGYFRSDQHSYAQPSRFLSDAARKHFDSVTARPADEREELPENTQSVRRSIKRNW